VTLYEKKIVSCKPTSCKAHLLKIVCYCNHVLELDSLTKNSFSYFKVRK
jgi:hypothetical protein